MTKEHRSIVKLHVMLKGLMRCCFVDFSRKRQQWKAIKTHTHVHGSPFPFRIIPRIHANSRHHEFSILTTVGKFFFLLIAPAAVREPSWWSLIELKSSKFSNVHLDSPTNGFRYIIEAMQTTPWKLPYATVVDNKKKRKKFARAIVRGSQGSDERTTVKEEEIDFPSCRHFLKNKNKNQAWMATVARHNLWLFDFRTARRWSAQKKKKKTRNNYSNFHDFCFHFRITSRKWTRPEGASFVCVTAYGEWLAYSTGAAGKGKGTKLYRFLLFYLSRLSIFTIFLFFFFFFAVHPTLIPHFDKRRWNPAGVGVLMCWCAESKVDSPCCK